MDEQQKTVQIKFHVTEEEPALIEQKMKFIPTDNMAVYMRKIAIDGYIIKIDHIGTFGFYKLDGGIL